MTAPCRPGCQGHARCPVCDGRPEVCVAVVGRDRSSRPAVVRCLVCDQVFASTDVRPVAAAVVRFPDDNDCEDA